MDLSKVTFPTFVLEPRSMLERITDFMSHPELIFEQVFPWSSEQYLHLIDDYDVPGLISAIIPRNDSSVYCNTI
jgi:Oxysterol-binding protein